MEGKKERECKVCPKNTEQIRTQRLEREERNGVEEERLEVEEVEGKKSKDKREAEEERSGNDGGRSFSVSGGAEEISAKREERKREGRRGRA